MNTTAIRALGRAQAERAQQALQRMQAGDIDGALALAGALVAEAADTADAQQTLALCLAAAGRHADAERAFRAALACAPGHPAILSNLATALRRLGRLDEAAALLAEAAAAAPQQARLQVDLGLVHLERGDVDAARRVLERAVQIPPPSAFAWHALGSARRADHDLDAAADAFTRATELAPQSASAWANLGSVQRLQGQPERALHSFDAAIRQRALSPPLLDARTGALLDAGDIVAAHRNAMQLVQLQPDFVPGHVTLANLRWEYGALLDDETDAVAGFTAAADAQPRHAELQTALIGFLLEARQPLDALERVQHLRQGGDHALLVSLQANALEMLGRRVEAAPLYAAACRSLGNDPSFLNAYARHLLAVGDVDGAAARAEQALAIDRNDQEAWAYLATAWRLAGDAREHWLCDYERLVTAIDLEPPPGWADIDGFLTALREVLDGLHRAGREPVQQSLRHGSQTPGRLFGRPQPLLTAAQTMLQQAAERWLQALPADPAHPFLSRRRSGVRFAGSWSVKLWSSGRHAHHIHSQGWASSAFYVALPPSVRDGHDDAGCIRFGVPPDELGLALPPRRALRPRAGRLVLFPSYLWHGTVPFHDSEPRITIAFDLLPR